jgi:hypothetical protein
MPTYRIPQYFVIFDAQFPLGFAFLFPFLDDSVVTCTLQSSVVATRRRTHTHPSRLSQANVSGGCNTWANQSRLREACQLDGEIVPTPVHDSEPLRYAFVSPVSIIVGLVLR